MPEGQVLEFSGITKRFGAVTAVSDFSARVEPGRVTGFLGPNGAGKTTTLRVLLGLVRATGGTATIGGVPYASLRQPLQSVGAVLEASSFHPGRTAANHLKVYAQAAGLPGARVDEALGVVGLADVAGRKVGGFSLGMRQRLGLAYALLGDPGVLVLDEPANGLDPEGIKWMRGFLRRLAQEGRTVFVSSHLLAEVQQTVDSVLIIAQGRLVYQGALEDLADPSEFTTVVDSPDRAALREALDAAGASSELFRSGLTVRGLEPAEVGAIAASSGIALSSLQRRGPALEEVFLDLVSGARVHPTGMPAAAFGAVPPLTPIADAETDSPAGEPASAAADAAADAASPAAEARPERTTDAARDTAPSAGPATYAVAGTGVIDIIPSSAGHRDSGDEPDDLPVDPDVDVEELGGIDVELARDADSYDPVPAAGGDTGSAVESGILSSEAPDTEIADSGPIQASDADDRPWERYVKTDADVEADAFFASFTDAEEADAAAADAEPPVAASEQPPPEPVDRGGPDADEDGGQRR